jgi:hypothetical protein
MMTITQDKLAKKDWYRLKLQQSIWQNNKAEKMIQDIS